MNDLPKLVVKISADGRAVVSEIGKARKSLKDMDKGMSDLARTAARSGAAVAAAFTAAGGSMLLAAKSAARVVTEIGTLSKLANTNTTTFQRWTAAARSLGVEQDKVADILKDVTEKVGEFLSTGGGPMADFFEHIAPKVGVTAEQFARLSGPEALQLYVDSLEQAGLSQEQMTFYLEALSGDLTRLLPLLRNGGAQMKALGDAAEAAGGIFSQAEIEAGRELQALFDDLGRTLSTSTTKAVLEWKDELIALARWIAETGIPALSDLMAEIGKMGAALAPAIAGWKLLGNTIAAALGRDSPYDTVATEGTAAEAELEAGDQAFSRDQAEGSSTGTWPLDENGNVIMDDGGPPLQTRIPVVIPPSGSKKTKGGGGGGASRTERDLDRLRKAFLSEQELLQEQFDARLEQLEKARAAELLTEEEYNALKLQAQAKYIEASAALDRQAIQSKLQAWGGALGDLAGLMSSKSKGLFQVGKMAAIAQGIVDGISSALTAWDKGMKIGGPATAATFAAFSVARTGAMLASLKATSFDGGGGTAASAGTGATPAPAASPAKVAQYQISGDVLGKSSTEALFRQINEGIKDGYTIYNVEWV